MFVSIFLNLSYAVLSCGLGFQVWNPRVMKFESQWRCGHFSGDIFQCWRNVWSSRILKKSIRKITSWSRFEAYFAYFRCVRSQIIINMLPKIGRNSIWVSDSLDVFGESQNLRSPSWDLHWHDFRSPTGASVQFRHKLCRDILQQAEVCFFACYWFELWKGQPVEQAGSVDVKLLHLLEVSWSFPRHVSRQCMVEVTHGCFGVSGTHDFCFIYLWGKSIVADELWLQLCSSLKTRSSYPEWCLRKRTS